MPFANSMKPFRILYRSIVITILAIVGVIFFDSDIQLGASETNTPPENVVRNETRMASDEVPMSIVKTIEEFEPKELTGSLNISGKASYYADAFHGRLTANGERFDMNGFTTAHKSLPFGTILRVSNLTNNSTVLVMVNDRGPYVHGRVLDLSRAAARTLDASVAPVKATGFTQNELKRNDSTVIGFSGSDYTAFQLPVRQLQYLDSANTFSNAVRMHRIMSQSESKPLYLVVTPSRSRYQATQCGYRFFIAAARTKDDDFNTASHIIVQ